jgi:DNA segregation ATPase FtsK/SpoIIIE-like protein
MSNVDSKTMLDCSGAEKLLDRGDSLYALAGSPKPQRMQTAYISDGEVNALLSSISVNEETEIFDPTVIDVFRAELEKFPKLIKRPSEEDEEKEEAEDGSIFQDQCFLEAVELTLSLPKISTSLLQRKLSIGFGRAMRYLDNMEKLELISPMNGQRPRDVIATPDEWHQSLLLAGITPLTPKKEEIEEEDAIIPTRLIRASAEEISAYENDRQFIEAVEIALSVGKISTSLIQRQLSIGYGKAAKFIDIMEDMGIVSEANGHRPREIRITPEEWKAKLERIMEDKN